MEEGLGPERRGRTDRSRSEWGYRMFLGSGRARPRLSQSLLEVCGAGLLRSCLFWVVPTVLPQFGGLGREKRRGESNCYRDEY